MTDKQKAYEEHVALLCRLIDYHRERSGDYKEQLQISESKNILLHIQLRRLREEMESLMYLNLEKER